MPGTLSANSWGPGYELVAILPDGTMDITNMGAETYIVGDLGVVTAMIAVSGYDLYVETFDVIEVYGQLTVRVAGGANAVVRLADAGGVELFSATCDASGNYDFGETFRWPTTRFSAISSATCTTKRPCS